MNVLDALVAATGGRPVRAGDDVGDDYGHDEALTVAAVRPAYVACPTDAAEVAALLAVATEHGLPVTARGSGTGLSGACTPTADALLISFEGMDRILEIDTENFVAVVQPGVTLAQLDEALAPLGLAYPVYPGEYSASLGGNMATNLSAGTLYVVTVTDMNGCTATASGAVMQPVLLTASASAVAIGSFNISCNGVQMVRQR